MSKQGIEIVGSPLGSDAFCTKYLEKEIDHILHRAEGILQLHPQVAGKLLHACVSPAPAYISQLCPPHLTRPIFALFDRKLWNLWMKILGDTDDQLYVCVQGRKRARGWAYLPARMGGTGLRSWFQTSSFSWFCSLASCIAAKSSLKKGYTF